MIDPTPDAEKRDIPAVRRATEAAAVLLICLMVMLLIKWPYFGLPLLYFDDGETLYHVFALLNGHLPYRDTYTHHFVGYVIPIFTLAKIIGYSTDLIRYSFLLNQALLGLGMYLCARIFFDRKRSLTGALLTITAREPFIYSFFPLAQISCCSVFILWLSLCYLKKPRMRTLTLSALACGLAFVIDQRGILLFLLPLLSVRGERHASVLQRCSRALVALTVCVAIPLIILLSFWQLGILEAFIHQTITFPRQFRVASLSAMEQMVTAISMHRFLVTETPLLLALALAGVTKLSLLIKADPPLPLRDQYILIAWMPLILFAIASLGGRDFSYYTIPWLPWLSLVALFSPELLSRRSLPGKAVAALLLSPILVALFSLPSLMNYLPELKKRDEALRISAIIRERLQPGETLFVFGYRPDIYAAMPIISASPLVNVIYIHPDSLITSYEQRLRHIDPEIEQEFISWFEKSPPTYLVFADLKLGEADQSPSATFVRKQIKDFYSLEFETTGPELQGHRSMLTLYKTKRTLKSSSIRPAGF